MRRNDEAVRRKISESARIISDDTEDIGTFSLWYMVNGEKRRVYWNPRRKEYVYQRWTPCTMKQSNVPTFFG